MDERDIGRGMPGPVGQERYSGGGGDVHTGLPLQPCDQQGSVGDTGVRIEALDTAELPPVRDADGQRPGGRPRKGHRSADAGDGGGLPAGDDGNRPERQIGKIANVLTLKNLDRTQLADVSDGYRESPEEADTDTSAARLRHWNGLDVGGKFGAIVQEALDAVHETLTTELDPESKEFSVTYKVKAETARTMLQVAARTRKARFSEEDRDLLKQILADLKGQKRELASRVEGDTSQSPESPDSGVESFSLDPLLFSQSP